MPGAYDRTWPACSPVLPAQVVPPSGVDSFDRYRRARKTKLVYFKLFLVVTTQLNNKVKNVVVITYIRVHFVISRKYLRSSSHLIQIVNPMSVHKDSLRFASDKDLKTAIAYQKVLYS